MDLEAFADELLIKRVCARDVEAFGVLYRRYELRVFSFLFRCAGNRALAEDLLQETFWRVWQAARTFDPARGGFRSWLYRVALNATRSELGLKRYSCERPDGIIPDGSDLPRGRKAADDPEIRFERTETEALVAAALARLSPALREVVALRCLEGMKFSEIAAVTGAPAGTLKTRFHRAVTELRRRLAPGEQ
jgi:RNA polymerase sigma-70 factor (ECF subfamily)